MNIKNVMTAVCCSLLSVSVFAQVKITKGGHVYLGQYLNPENVVSVGVIAPPTGLPTVSVGTGKFNIVSHYRTGLVIDHIDPNAWSWGSICNSNDKTAKHWISSQNGSHNFFVTADGTVYSKSAVKIASDSNLKFNVSTISNPLSKINALRGVTFRYKPSATCSNCHTDTLTDSATSQPLKYGFIAQEVASVVPELVTTADGTTKYLEPLGVVPILVEGMKAQQATIDQMQLQMDLLTAQLNQCCQLQGVVPSGGSNSGTSNLGVQAPVKVSSKSVLYQNQPNPFDKETQINYEIVSGANDAYIYIYNMNGTQLKQIPIKQSGKGSVTVQSNDLTAGMYYYALIVEGKEVDTKKMILTK